MQTELLLAEFQPIKTVEWDAAIARDLDGADYEKKLIWHTEEGFAVKPFYRAEDLRELASLDAGPGEFPYRRGGRANGDWQINERHRFSVHSFASNSFTRSTLPTLFAA